LQTKPVPPLSVQAALVAEVAILEQRLWAAEALMRRRPKASRGAEIFVAL